MGKPTRKYQGSDERCPKCGDDDLALQTAKYTNSAAGGPGTYDVLTVRCARCGYGWEVLPLDAEVPRPPPKMAKVLVEVLNPVVMTAMSRECPDFRPGDRCTLTVRAYRGKWDSQDYVFDVPIDDEAYHRLQEEFVLGKCDLKLAIVEV